MKKILKKYYLIIFSREMLFHLILHLNNFSFPFNESIANTILLDVSNIYLIKFEISITLILFILSTNNSIKIKKGC